MTMKRLIGCLALGTLLLLFPAGAENAGQAPDAGIAAESTAEPGLPAEAAGAEDAASAPETAAPELLLTAGPDLESLEPEAATDTAFMVVETAGMQETVAQSRFTEEQIGFTFLYDSDYLSVYDTLSEDGTAGAVYVNPSDPENTQLISIQFIPAPILGVTAQEYLDEIPMLFELDDVGQMDQIVMDSGVCFSFRAGFKADMYYMFFTLTGGKTDLCLLVRYPLEVIETYGARFDRLIWSFDFTEKNR